MHWNPCSGRQLDLPTFHREKLLDRAWTDLASQAARVRSRCAANAELADHLYSGEKSDCIHSAHGYRPIDTKLCLERLCRQKIDDSFTYLDVQSTLTDSLKALPGLVEPRSVFVVLVKERRGNLLHSLLPLSNQCTTYSAIISNLILT